MRTQLKAGLTAGILVIGLAASALSAPAAAAAPPAAAAVTSSDQLVTPEVRKAAKKKDKTKKKKTVKCKLIKNKKKRAKCKAKKKKKQQQQQNAPIPYSPGGSVIVPGTVCPIFPADNYWNTPVSHLPVSAKSAAWMSSIGTSRNLHPDFGPSYGEQSLPYGIPVTVVDGSHPTVNVSFDYDDESDKVPYPLGSGTLIEGGSEAGGDRHTIVVDSSTCRLYETWNTWPGNPWTAGSGATWDLRSNALRPDGWTSADAAGLPILPGLLTYDEVKAGAVNHAIRFTASSTRSEYLWPARHKASSNTSASVPPMGARFRLKSSFDMSGYSADAQVVLRGMQQYGMVLADNGSNWFFQGTADSRWEGDLVSDLKGVPASAFEAVETGSMMVQPNSGQARR